MPDAEGKLTAEDHKYVQDWMAKQGAGNHPCPICGKTQWTIGQHLVHPSTIGGGGVTQFAGVRYPNVILLSPCGYTRYMNAVLIGLVSPKL